MAENKKSESNKKQKKKLKKVQARQAKAQEKRKKALLKWGKLAILLLLVAVGVATFFLLQPDTSNAGVLRVAQTEYSFGVVSLQGGVVTTTIPLVNIGEGPLTITALETSCGCTTASVINNGAEGPAFGMPGHGSNPTGWQTEIQPGEQALLKIYYNPAVHSDLRGPVTRVISIYSDDPANPKQEVRIKVSQIG